MSKLEIELAKNGFILKSFSPDPEEADEKIVVEFEDDWSSSKKFFEELVPLIAEAFGINYYESGRAKYSKRGFKIIEVARKDTDKEFKEVER